MTRKRKRPSWFDGLSPADRNDFESLQKQAITKLSQMPDNMTKYWYHRHSLFSLFSQGILLDQQSWYSVTPESIAARIAKRCACDTILDAFCGAGGNAIQFAFTCKRVIAVDIDPVKIQLAKWNAAIYGVQDRIEFHVADYLEFIDKCTDPIDVVFLSPPWGGVEYLRSTVTLPDKNGYTDVYNLDQLTPLPADQLLQKTVALTHNIAFYLPRNSDLDQIAQLVPLHPTHVGQLKLEEQWLGPKFSAITCYFGQLASDWDDDADDWKNASSKEQISTPSTPESF